MSSIVSLRQAIVDAIDADMGPDATVPLFKTVQVHGGRFDRAELARVAIKSPAALVAVLGGPLTREGGVQAVGDLVYTVFIVTRGSSQIKRDEHALILSEAVAGLVVSNDWDFEDAQAPMDMAMANLYSGALDRGGGVALWSVAWNQSTDLAIYDVSTLDDLHSVVGDFDVAPKDGVPEIQAYISLNGEFMSAYGHIYVSTSAATAIAVAGTYQKAAGTTTLKEALTFDMPTNNRVRHTGTASKPILVSAGASVTVDSDAKVTLALAKNGTVDTNTAIEQEITAAGGAETIDLRGLFQLTTNDYAEVWVTADDTVNVTLTKLNVVAAAT